MRVTGSISLSFVLLVTAAPSSARHVTPRVLSPNDNTVSAGVLRDGELTLAVEAQDSRWHDKGGAVPGTPVEAFAERGKGPSIPGPLVRVPVGTVVRASVHNTLPRAITFFLPTSPTADDSIVVAPGATGEIRTRPAMPGNYMYRATTATPSSDQLRVAGVMAGAFVVDSAGAARPPRDRVMMILMTPDSALVAAAETDNVITSTAGRFAFTINGLSWPHTPRVATRVGDTLHWRVLNGSADVHPMHLHGFYYRVDAFTGLNAARDGQGDAGRTVVTERMSAFSAMSMTWIPERAGNWLLHCHFALHLEPLNATTKNHDNHALTGMVGLVIGINVAPRGAERVAADRPRRKIRLVAVHDSTFAEPRPSLRFELEEDGRRTIAPSGFSPTLYLTRNEPVSITVVNRMGERTAVHWHGMELESYYDGVAGLSGVANRLAPTIAPGDSFEVRFSPPRAGTFMYHSHVDDTRQQRAGLVGAMIVLDGAPAASSDDHEIFLKGSRAGSVDAGPLEIGGMTNRDTVVLRAGRVARLRFMSLAATNANATVRLTTRPDSAFFNPNDLLVARWTPVAKDGADLPAASRSARAARQIISMGETYDFEYTPPQRGMILRIEVRGAGGRGPLLARVPIKVE